MTWPTHSVIALSGLWLLYAVEPETMHAVPGLLIACTVLGGLLPDLDATDSKLQRIALPHCAIRPFHVLASLIHLTSAHRGWMHSLRGLLIASTLAASCMLLAAIAGTAWPGLGVVELGAWAGFTIGYASHLLADMATPAGVPLYHPHTEQRHVLPRTWRITTASPEEEVVFVIFACLVLWLLLAMISNPAP